MTNRRDECIRIRIQRTLLQDSCKKTDCEKADSDEDIFKPQTPFDALHNDYPEQNAIDRCNSLIDNLDNLRNYPEQITRGYQKLNKEEFELPDCVQQAYLFEENGERKILAIVDKEAIFINRKKTQVDLLDNLNKCEWYEEIPKKIRDKLGY